MLALGVFGGKYMTDCAAEFPADWFEKAKLCPDRHDPALNHFGVNASQPLSVWRDKGWIYHEDPRGWFQWYCRYYLGAGAPTTSARSSAGALCEDTSRAPRQLHAARAHLPAPAAPSTAALGLRLAEDLNVARATRPWASL